MAYNFAVDFSPLADLPNVYKKAKAERTLAELGRGLASGSLDYRQAAGMAAEAGDLKMSLSLLGAARDESERAGFSDWLKGSSAPQSPQRQPAAMRASNIGRPSPVQEVAPDQFNSIDAMASPAGKFDPDYQPTIGKSNRAVAGIESQGSGDYSAVGVPASDGDRPFGKHQVMGKNIGPWTREILGRELTPQQFLTNPEAQDAVFNAKFGSYVQKYGPEGAARAWFAGEGGMNNPNARDRLGTSVAAYGDRFSAAMGGGQQGGFPTLSRPAPGGASRPIQVAQSGGGPAPGPAPVQGVPQAQQAPQTPQNVASLAMWTARLPKNSSAHEAAKVMLDNALKNSAMTPDQKEYLTAVGQGETDTFTAWTRKNKQAGATAITTDMRSEGAEARALGEGAGKRANETMEAAAKASRKLGSLSRMSGLLDGVQQGRIEPARMTISAWAKSFGLDDKVAESLGLDPKRVGDAQAVTALSNEMLLGNLGPGGFPAQNFSDTDRKFMEAILPRLMNDPRANKIILEVARRNAQLDVAKAKEWQTFRRSSDNKGRGYADFEIDWSDKLARLDLFGDLAKAAGPLIPAEQPQQQGMPSRKDIEAEIKRRGL